MNISALGGNATITADHTAMTGDIDLMSLAAPAKVDTALWSMSSASERADLLAQVPNPQPRPTPGARETGLPLGSLTTGQADGFWIGEDRGGIRRAYDPAVSSLGSVPAIRPDAGFQRSGGSVIFVNGLQNNQAQAANAGQLIANKTGGDVRVFFNASQGANDIPRAIGDNLNWLGVSRTPATNQLASTIATMAANGQSLHLMSTSHGSILTRNALYVAQEQLMTRYGYQEIKLPGLAAAVDPAGYQRQVQINSAAEAQTFRALQNIKIETFGSGTAKWDIDGPKYLHWVNTNDPVVKAAGIDFQGAAARLDSVAAGRDAVIVRFTSGRDGATESHFMETYLPRRIDTGSFDQVYNRGSTGNGGLNIIDLPGTRH